MIFYTIVFIQIIFTIVFCTIAAISDVKCNEVPDELTYSLIAFGLISNMGLSIISEDVKFILSSIILMVVTFAITYLFWALSIWAGGDTKLFTAIATVIPFGLNINFLNSYPILSVYPFVFSVIVNSILVSFPFIVIFVIHLLIKKDFINRNRDFVLNIFNIPALMLMIKSTLNNNISVKDLKEGMMVNNYYFNDNYISDLINGADGNLEVFKTKNNSNFQYYFKSGSAGGITKKDMYLLKIMSAQNFIGNSISVKVSFPFTPAILGGLLITIFFGDLMMIFTKNLFGVI